MSTTTAVRAAESVPHSFDALQVRFLSLTSRLEALKDTLGNSENMPIGLGAAAFVFRETTEEMVQLQEDIERLALGPRAHPEGAGGAIMSKVTAARTEASLDEQNVQFVRTVSSLSARGRAVLNRIITHLRNQPAGGDPVTKEQVAGWLREEGASENEVSSYLKSDGGRRA